jgi:RND family efflux transporter MFP subunit
MTTTQWNGRNNWAARCGAWTLGGALIVSVAACGGKPAGAPGGPGAGAFAMPAKIETVVDSQAQVATEYVATIKSRRSSTVQPQVDGVISKIFAKSGDHVSIGTPLLQIDPLKQEATVRSQESARALKQAALDYAKQQAERMRTLYQGGAVSKQSLDEAEAGRKQAEADYNSLGAQVEEQQVELRYYRVMSPEAGIVGDIPVRVGDRVTTATMLTTIDANQGLEVYISVPIERSADLKTGLPVELLGEGGTVLGRTQITFISPQVDSDNQSILVKAAVPPTMTGLRALEFVRARVVWATHAAPIIPMLAVSRVNGQNFVFVVDAATGGKTGLVVHQRLVQLGDLTGNSYVVSSGLKPGEKIVTAGAEKLMDGMSVQAAQ